MPEISDEMLMSYADGALGPAERRMMEELLRSDPSLARRLRAFEFTGRALSQLYDPVLAEPVPGHLIAAIERGAHYARRGPVPPSLGERLSDFLSSIIPVGRGLALAGAGALTVGALAVMAPQWLSTYSPDLASEVNGMRVARGVLFMALETMPSRTLNYSFGKDAAAVAVVTFENKDGGYCRQYETRDRAGQEWNGVACRDEVGEWRIGFEQPVSTAPALAELERPGKVPKIAGDETATEALGAHLSSLRPSGNHARIEHFQLPDAAEQSLLKNGWSSQRK